MVEIAPAATLWDSRRGDTNLDGELNGADLLELFRRPLLQVTRRLHVRGDGDEADRPSYERPANVV